MLPHKKSHLSVAPRFHQDGFWINRFAGQLHFAGCVEFEKVNPLYSTAFKNKQLAVSLCLVF